MTNTELPQTIDATIFPIGNIASRNGDNLDKCSRTGTFEALKKRLK